MRLGLCIGTKQTGYAVAENMELLDWGVKSLGGKWNRKKLQKIIMIIQALIRSYEVSHVSIKTPDILPASKGFIQLMGGLNIFFETEGIQVQYIRLTDLKKHYCNHTDVNKEALLRAIATKYPELYITYPRHQLTNTPYYNKVAEAIGTVLLC